MNLRFVFSLIVSLLSLLPAAAQDLTRNWIRERIFLDAEGKKCVTSVQYFDGIGRETLLLTDGLSPGGGVACSLSEQSFAGRTSAKWLPATGLTGFDFLTPERVKSLAVSSHEGDSVPFSLTRRDALGRVSSVRNAGGDLAGKAKYRFFVRDRLGSVRSVADEDGNVLQQNLYYARGGAWGDVCTAPGFQSYKYCGKYLDRKHGLDLYDYGARLYDPAAAFWTSPDPLCEKYYNISPYAFCNNNPVRFIDPTGEFPIETIWDIGNVLYDVGAAVVNHIKGDHQAAKANWVDLGLDAGAMLIPYVPAGTSKVLKAGVKGGKALDKATDAGKAARMTENAAKGKAFEKQVGESLGKNKASQVTIEAADGTRTKVDFVQKNDGKVTLTEAKGSQTAPLTPNQKKAHPQIEQSGGTVRGNKGSSIGLPNGEKIPPTKIEIIRPNDLKK